MNRLAVHLDHFRAQILARSLQDGLAEFLPDYWLRRAEAWEAARPRPGDYRGNATPDQLRAADARCAQIAENCRNHAALLRSQFTAEEIDEEVDEDVAYVIREVSAALAGEVAA